LDFLYTCLTQHLMTTPCPQAKMKVGTDCLAVQLTGHIGDVQWLVLWLAGYLLCSRQAMMKVGNEYLATQLTVMDNDDMPFLFGLDMLRRHQCQLDLRANVLRFTNLDVALPFLQPHELPKNARGALGAPPPDVPSSGMLY